MLNTIIDDLIFEIFNYLLLTEIIKLKQLNHRFLKLITAKYQRDEIELTKDFYFYRHKIYLFIAGKESIFYIDTLIIFRSMFLEILESLFEELNQKKICQEFLISNYKMDKVKGIYLAVSGSMTVEKSRFICSINEWQYSLYTNINLEINNNQINLLRVINLMLKLA